MLRVTETPSNGTVIAGSGNYATLIMQGVGQPATADTTASEEPGPCRANNKDMDT